MLNHAIVRDPLSIAHYPTSPHVTQEIALLGTIADADWNLTPITALSGRRD